MHKETKRKRGTKQEATKRSNTEEVVKDTKTQKWSTAALRIERSQKELAPLRQSPAERSVRNCARCRAHRRRRASATRDSTLRAALEGAHRSHLQWHCCGMIQVHCAHLSPRRGVCAGHHEVKWPSPSKQAIDCRHEMPVQECHTGTECSTESLAHTWSPVAPRQRAHHAEKSSQYG